MRRATHVQGMVWDLQTQKKSYPRCIGPTYSAAKFKEVYYSGNIEVVEYFVTVYFLP
jgi:hypothetical protein